MSAYRAVWPQNQMLGPDIMRVTLLGLWQIIIRLVWS